MSCTTTNSLYQVLSSKCNQPKISTFLYNKHLIKDSSGSFSRLPNTMQSCCKLIELERKILITTKNAL